MVITAIRPDPELYNVPTATRPVREEHIQRKAGDKPPPYSETSPCPPA